MNPYKACIMIANNTMSIWSDFVSLFFPRLCCACDEPLKKNENVCCSLCINALPKTDFHFKKDNPVAQVLWGKVSVFSTTAFYYFNKGNKVQHLIHQLKYKGGYEIGIFIGELMGYELKNRELFNTADVIIPVPLHPRKLQQRGYNQSEMIARGIAKGLNCPVNTDVLYRKVFTETQTRKSHSERWENVENVFDVIHQERCIGKHLLLVDDVITTGSTIEACIHALEKIPQSTISVVVLATAICD